MSNLIQRKRSAATRARILEAAGPIFAEAGLAGARTDAIAAIAGVNKALLYYYFKSKKDLYRAVIDGHFEEFSREALEILNTPGSARSILLSYVNLHFDFMSARLRYASLYQQFLNSDGKPLQQLVKKYFVPRGKALVKLLKRGIEQGEFRKVDLQHASLSIVSLIVFYFSTSRVMKIAGYADAFSKSNLKRRKQEIINFISYGLFLDPLAPLS